MKYNTNLADSRGYMTFQRYKRYFKASKLQLKEHLYYSLLEIKVESLCPQVVRWLF